MDDNLESKFNLKDILSKENLLKINSYSDFCKFKQQVEWQLEWHAKMERTLDESGKEKFKKLMEMDLWLRMKDLDYHILALF